MNGGIASRGQLRMSFVRWAIVCVPLLLLLGFLSGRSVPVGDESAWYVALAKPAGTPPGIVFPVAWSLLYVLMGIALAMVLNARGAAGRPLAVALFVVQFVLNLVWTPLFFGAHRVHWALIEMLLLLVAATATTVLFARIRPVAGWLLVPYLAWLCFAAALTLGIARLNPNAEAIVQPAASTQIIG